MPTLPDGGRMVLETSKKTKHKELPLRGLPPIARGVGVVVEGCTFSSLRSWTNSIFVGHSDVVRMLSGSLEG